MIMSDIDSVSSVGESPSGTEEFSVDLGEGSLNINVSATATAKAEAGGGSSAENTSEQQSAKDMEGTDSDYLAEVPGGLDADKINDSGTGESDGKPVDSEIEEMKEGIADGLMAIEELQPGFIEDLMAQIEDDQNETNPQVADDVGLTTYSPDAVQGEDGTSSSQDKDTVQDEDGTSSEDSGQDEQVKPLGDTEVGGTSGGTEDLLASLEELAIILEDILGTLDAGETQMPDAGEAGETTSNPVDTFMEIFEQMSPDAQNEVVEILVSRAFGEKGIESADAVSDDAMGEIQSGKAVDTVEG
jgi:hypothetical protein